MPPPTDVSLPLSHLPQPVWTSDLNVPGLRFLICKAGTILDPKLVGVKREVRLVAGLGRPSGGHPGNCRLRGPAGLRGGRMTLVFGCRRPEEDHLYREEMLEMAQNGVLHAVHTAYSRLPGQPKVNAAAAPAGGRGDFKSSVWRVPRFTTNSPSLSEPPPQR